MPIQLLNRNNAGNFTLVNRSNSGRLTLQTAAAAAPITYTIGQSALGGTIAYILQSGDPGYNANIQHGLVIATTTTTTNTAWNPFTNSFSNSYGTSTAIGTGAANTAIIIAANLGTTAAAACAAVNAGGYNDWYLPSRYELDAINNALTSGYNFVAGKYYWSSSEVGSNYSAWCTQWNGPYGGGWSVGQSNNNGAVYSRAVRSF